MSENADSAHRQVLFGKHYKSGLPIRITVEDEIIADIQTVNTEGTGSWEWIGPGFTDLQINGFRNDDFNSRALEVGDVIRMTRRLWQEGVTTYYPTIITNQDDAIRHNVACIHQACLTDTSVRSCIGGIHLEGPFISIEDGARGAHPRQHVIAPDWDLFAKWQEAAGRSVSLPFLRNGKNQSPLSGDALLKG